MAQDTIQTMHTAGDIDLLAATVMPDHVHFLFRLGTRLRVGQIMGKFKTKSRACGRVPWHWQEDGFEHQLRSIESIEDYGLYIFLNPYRAGLCPPTSSWPGWLCPQPSAFQFFAIWITTQSVPTEWFAEGERIAAQVRRRC